MNNYYSPSLGTLYGFIDEIDYIAIGTVPTDSIVISDDLYYTLTSGCGEGRSIALDKDNIPYCTELTPAQVMAKQYAINEEAIQQVLDSTAQSRKYNDIKSACAFSAPSPIVASDNPNYALCEKFRLEGNALQIWMTATWANAIAYLLTVESGINPMPTSDEAIAMMPTFTWPD